MSIIQYKNNDRLLLAIDCIIFGFDGKHLKGLFVKRRFEPQKDKWSLMGGFVNSNESVNNAAVRILNELTGLGDIYMEQLFCFGNADRDPGGRVVSMSYFALIRIDDYTAELMETHNARWFELNKMPRLIFDHKQMVKLAKERLQQKVSNHPIGFELLPDKFTLPQLQFTVPKSTFTLPKLQFAAPKTPFTLKKLAFSAKKCRVTPKKSTFTVPKTSFAVKKSTFQK